MKKVAQLAVIALVLFASARWLIPSLRGHELPPDTPESVTFWICDTCHLRYDLTARKLDAWDRDPHRRRRDPNVPDPAQMVFWCEACRMHSVCRADFCGQHQQWYCPQTSAGAKHP